MLVLYVTVIHIIETVLLAANIRDADWLFPMRAFLYVANNNHCIAALLLGICAFSGLSAPFIGNNRYKLKIILFMMQGMPVILSAIWAFAWAYLGISAHSRYDSSIALLLNQSPRIGWAFLYPIAVISIVNRK